LRTNKAKLLKEEADIPLDDPIWSPDGQSFVHVAHRNPSVVLRHHIATGVDETLMTVGDGVVLIEDWSDDGKFLIGFRISHPLPLQIVLLSIDKPGQPEYLKPAGTKVDEFDLSPDGTLMVYQNFQIPDWEIVLHPVRGGGSPIHLADGLQPRFAPDGKSIYYLSFDGAMKQIPVPSPLDGPLSLPTLLFKTGLDQVSDASDQYRIGRNGEKFLLVRPIPNLSEQVQIVRPWYNLMSPQH
jgi:WD40-like Beta Propeller Repeat